jgi:hypothetical protein
METVIRSERDRPVMLAKTRRRSAARYSSVRRQIEESSMNTSHRRWLYYSLAIAAIVCSMVSLFALFELNAPSWISSLNVLAVVLVLLAVKARSHTIRSTQSPRHKGRPEAG